uniref:Mitochondrial calcium uniporter regulator 1 n=1 Tax=Nothobranchius furzeri TaxID=105023 RepID=A0A8C6MJ60_NOTFU
ARPSVTTGERCPIEADDHRHRSCFPVLCIFKQLRAVVEMEETYDLKPDVPQAGGRKLFFDTHAVVRLLEENGLSTQQAEVLVQVLLRTTSSNMEIIYSDMVTKVQQEISLLQVMSKIAAVKKDMVILEKSEFSTLLAENEDVMSKLRSDNSLDINMEKSRAKELVEQDRHLTHTNMKIDTEVAGLKTMLEAHKLDTIKYLAGETYKYVSVLSIAQHASSLKISYVCVS